MPTLLPISRYRFPRCPGAERTEQASQSFGDKISLREAGRMRKSRACRLRRHSPREEEIMVREAMAETPTSRFLPCPSQKVPQDWHLEKQQSESRQLPGCTHLVFTCSALLWPDTQTSARGW